MDEKIKKFNFSVFGRDRDLNKIKNTFRWLKSVTGISQKYLYLKALEWISKDSMAQQRFLQYLEKERI